MRTEAQREASRINGAKSRGPKTPEGKAITRFNGLTHTLCAAQAVLPGEDPAQFQAHRDALFDDWRPMSYTRSLLVERLAIASWRLRRAVLSESALRGRAADDAVRAFDGERQEAVERAVDRFEDDPRAALTLLRSSALGIDRLMAAWGELDAALEGGPAGWSQRYHRRLMLLLGHPDGTDLITAGPLPIASARLLAARKPGVRPLPAGEAEEPVAGLRRLAAQAIDRLRDLRRDAPDHSGDRRRSAEAASGDVTAEAVLRHRYEMALDRSLRATIYQLLALERSGADLPEPAPAAGTAAVPDGPPPAPGTEVEAAPADPASTGSPPPAAEGAAPGSLGAGEPGSIPTPVAAPIRDPRGPDRAPAGAGRRPEISTHEYQRGIPDPVGARSARRRRPAGRPGAPRRGSPGHSSPSARHRLPPGPSAGPDPLGDPRPGRHHGPTRARRGPIPFPRGASPWSRS